MNVYKVRLGMDGHTYDRLWSAKTMSEAIELTFRQWLEDNAGEHREFFETDALRGVDMVGELENQDKV